MGKPSASYKLIYETSQSKDSLPVSRLCALYHVSRSGCYRWLKAQPVRQNREEQDRKDFEFILSAFKAHNRFKGARSIQMQLLHQDPPIEMNLKKIRRLMHKFNLSCPLRKANPYRRMAKALRTANVADNLVRRQFEAYGPRRILLTDITYIPFGSRFAYLSTILDAYTKEILAYVVSDSLEVDFVLKTVEQLLENHGDELYPDTVIHSDQGSHYTSYSYTELLRSRRIRQSMSRKGNCWDNACQESFFGHMKDEIREPLRRCHSFAEIKNLLTEQIEYYNHYRYQWKLAKLAPCQFYEYWKTGVYPIQGVRIPPVLLNRKQTESVSEKASDSDRLQRDRLTQPDCGSFSSGDEESPSHTRSSSVAHAPKPAKGR